MTSATSTLAGSPSTPSRCYSSARWAVGASGAWTMYRKKERKKERKKDLSILLHDLQLRGSPPRWRLGFVAEVVLKISAESAPDYDDEAMNAAAAQASKKHHRQPNVAKKATRELCPQLGPLNRYVHGPLSCLSCRSCLCSERRSCAGRAFSSRAQQERSHAHARTHPHTHAPHDTPHHTCALPYQVAHCRFLSEVTD